MKPKLPDFEFNGTQLDEVLEEHEFTTDEVPPQIRRRLPPYVETELRQSAVRRIFDDLDGRRR